MYKISKKIAGFFANPKKKKIYAITTGLLVAAVVFSTAHFLILPAITMEKAPICGLEEHQHSDSCYKDEKVLVCTIPEGEEHKHTQECYKIERTLICTKKEHVHTAECFEQADLKADKESEEDWQRSVASAKLNGKWSHDIAEIAKTQIDYKESTKNFVYGSDGEKKGYTRYGDWFGNKYADWNTMFVSFCLNYANVPQDILPYRGTSDIKQWTTALKKHGLYKIPEKTTPEEGDLLFIDTDKDGQADEVAVVESVKSKQAGEGKVTAIKGNHNNKVERQSYSLKDKKVAGFGKLGSIQNFNGTLLNSSKKTETGTYWKRVTELSELKAGEKYIIVSVQGNYALKNTGGQMYYYEKNCNPVKIHSIKGNPNYFKIDGVVNENKLDFRYVYNKRNFTSGNYIIDPAYRNKVFIQTPNQGAIKGLKITKSYLTKDINKRVNQPDNAWDIAVTMINNYGYYYDTNLNFAYKDYVNNYNGINFHDVTFIGTDYSELALPKKQTDNYYKPYQYEKTQAMLIFKECPNLTLNIPDDAQVRPEDGGGGTAVKPKYPEYINPSNEITGTYKDKSGSTINYYSDPSTSKIESLFGNHPIVSGQNDYQAQLSDNGKTMTDKSVVYGKDDYSAFSDYKDGEFSVTLSALGQVFDMNKGVSKVPIDVLFILDMSNSMNQNDKNNVNNRAEVLAVEMNKIFDKILKSHPANRICAVGFNSYSMDLFDLRRPKADWRGNYIEAFKTNEYDSVFHWYKTAIRLTETGSNSMTCDYGTFTQRGIAQGYEIMTKNKDTSYETVINGEKVKVQRKPVVILVSDGEPTHSTNFYMDPLHSPVYGDGLSQVVNAKGAHGYYTILTANYFKRMIGIHYDNPASMYTLAFGMKEGDFTVQSPADATNHHKATVMHPTNENISKLGQVGSPKREYIEFQMKNLLEGNMNYQYTIVGAHFDQPKLPNESTYIPLNTANPYRGNYNYADEAFLNNSTGEEIGAAFQKIVDSSAVKTFEYSYETVSNIPITISDPIGEGMEMKGDPILRINGKNYAHTSKNTQGNTTTYHFNYGKVPMDNFSNKKIDTNIITATVIEDAAGNQTVTMNIPASALPVYLADKTLSFFYEALPARLIYKVGISPEGQKKIDSLSQGQTATFYTNRYQEGKHAAGVILPTAENPYYSKDGWKHNNNKTSNTTGTDEFSVIVDGTNTNVRQELGNNGKLVINKGSQTVVNQISVEKKWLDYEGKPTTDKLPEKLTATLYRTYEDTSGKTVKENVLEFTLDASISWKRTFTSNELNEVPGRVYQYYVNEQAIEGYKVKYEGDGVSSNTPETPIVITNKYKYGDFVLPSTGGTGTIVFAVTGIALMTAALGYGYVLNRKRKKSDGK